MKEKERNGISQSFVMGVISLVFLIIGYQTALLIHNSALTKIAACRDVPDTVYVFRERGVSTESVPSGDSVQRRYASHSPRVQAIRDKLPGRQVESFRFDPNTVSVEDLCRLGFTAKQAMAIDNYRKKGGRFRRKEDFARSYVVSDSVYQRLQQYVEIPLIDLNLADSAAFDALPGIGGWFASRMSEYRKQLGGYSYKEQLMDIWKFDQEKYDALSDLIVVSPEHVKPYPLWSLPVDSLRLHPYIGDYAAKGIVLYRDNNPRSLWTVDSLVSAGVLREEDAARLRRCAIALPE